MKYYIQTYVWGNTFYYRRSEDEDMVFLADKTGMAFFASKGDAEFVARGLWSEYPGEITVQQMDEQNNSGL